jgi:hypothetical protein
MGLAVAPHQASGMECLRFAPKLKMAIPVYRQMQVHEHLRESALLASLARPKSRILTLHLRVQRDLLVSGRDERFLCHELQPSRALRELRYSWFARI